jgi:catechol 2,3-dioxygenase-like lactoylglutathione lyase family enzyme
MIESMCPFFIVSHVPRTVAFYADKLGFETSFQEPKQEPFLAVLQRDDASLITTPSVSFVVLPLVRPAGGAVDSLCTPFVPTLQKATARGEE